MNFDNKTEAELIKISEKGVLLEGNILKVLKSNNEEFKSYLNKCNEKDSEKRKKRLSITKEIQKQNKDLVAKQDEIEILNNELKLSLENAESVRDEALNSLEVIQKRTQFELVSIIVKIALAIVIGVGFLTTAIYMVALFSNKDTQLIGNTWSSLFGILLTNSFSIIGTIMGVKYASKEEK